MIFVGFRRDVPRLMAACDLIVMTSRHEGLGSSLMEAQAAGKPIVATKVGGIPEIVTDGESGFLVPAGDHPAVADRLLRLLGDAALVAAMGGAGRRRAVAEFSISNLVDAHKDVYGRCAVGAWQV